MFANNNPDYDEVKAAQWQATQVSTVSIMNCLGRITIGLLRLLYINGSRSHSGVTSRTGVIADFTKGKLRLPRSYCMVIVATLFIISQVMTFSIESISNLWKASALLGFAYGGLFGLFPTLVIEWFGLGE